VRLRPQRDYLGRAVEPTEILTRYVRRTLRPRYLALWRTRPLSHRWGADRGTPVDRYYIESFLEENRDAIRGSVLEVKGTVYTDRFGVDVRERNVLDLEVTNERATIIADLTRAHSIPSDSFDCFVLTQTLQYIYDVRAAVHHAYRVLRPRGVLLCTVPAVSQIEPGSLEHEYWRFTVASCTRLFEDVFGVGNVVVRSYGNVLSAVAFLSGMAAEELRRHQLDRRDEHFPLVLTARAVKA
jgi:SAM-dependent methyltransferase